MLRISPIPSGNQHAILRLEGRIAGPWVAELQRACERLLGEGLPVELECSEVEYVDAEGVSLVATLKSRGISLVGCSPFVEKQLRGA